MAGNVKICNLDLIAPITKRELVIGDKTYRVKPLSVKKFIELTKMRQSVTAETSLEDAVKMMIDMVSGMVVGLEREVIESLPFAQLQTIVAFINGEIPDEDLEPKKPLVAGEAVTDEKAPEGEDASGK